MNTIGIVRAAALVQGLALVTVPTLASVLLDPHAFGFSQATYGSLFISQSLIAVAVSLAGGVLTQRLGMRRVVALGLVANALAMAAVFASVFALHDAAIAYLALTCGTSLLGFGFAILTPALNTLSAESAPADPDRSVLVTNALLGLAAALAPLLLFVFVGLHVWWLLPLLSALAFAGLVGLSRETPFPTTVAATGRQTLPGRFWLFAAFALCYGFCEQIVGSWAQVYMEHDVHASARAALIALALFWGVAAAGRVASSLTEKRLPSSVVFRGLPFVLAATFAALAVLPGRPNVAWAIALFAIAGAGVSALLPLVLSFAQEAMPAVRATATSSVFAVYLIGYGLAAYGAGPLQTAGFSLATIYGASAPLALAVALLAAMIVRLQAPRKAEATTASSP